MKSRRRRKKRNSKSPKVDDQTTVDPRMQFPSRQQKISLSSKPKFSVLQTATLANIKDMFLGLDSDWIEQVYSTLHCDSMRVIDYILEFKNQSLERTIINKEEKKLKSVKINLEKKNIEATLTGMPIEIYLHICEHLDLFAYGNLSAVCHLLEVYTQTIYENTTQLSFYRYRHWSDSRILAMIARFSNLENLSLRKCINFDSFQSLPRSCFASAATIKSLNLAQCREIRDRDLSGVLDTLERLEELDVAQSLVSDDTIDSLVKNNALVYLCLADCKHVSSKSIKRLITGSKSLKSINLKGTQMTSEIFDAFNRRVSLRKLNLSRCKRLSTCIMGNKNCGLKELNLSDNVGLRQVELYCPSLTSLNLSLCKYLVTFIMHLPAPGFVSGNLSGDLNLAEIKMKPTNLRDINLFSCRSITSDSLTQMISSTASLSWLNCGGMIQLNYRMLSEILRTCPYLIEMELTGCKGLPFAAVKAAREVLVDHAAAIKKSESKKDVEKHLRQESKVTTFYTKVEGED